MTRLQQSPWVPCEINKCRRDTSKRIVPHRQCRQWLNMNRQINSESRKKDEEKTVRNRIDKISSGNNGRARANPEHTKNGTQQLKNCQAIWMKQMTNNRHLKRNYILFMHRNALNFSRQSWMSFKLHFFIKSYFQLNKMNNLFERKKTIELYFEFFVYQIEEWLMWAQ